MSDQLTVNQDVLDDGICCTSVNPSSSLPCANGDMMSPSNLQSSTTCPNHGLAASHPIIVSSPNHRGQPAVLSGLRASDAPSSSTSYSCHDSTQEQYSTRSVSGSKPLSNHGSWHNPPTLHNNSTQYDPVLGGTCAPAMGDNCWPSHAFPMQYPDVYPEIPTSDLLLYNEPSHQWQNSAIPPPDPLQGWGRTESLQMRLSSQAHGSHDGTISHPSYHPPTTNQPYSIPLPNHPSLSCRWLCDDVLCEFTGTLEALKAHCKTCHFSGPPNAQIQCRWEACDYHKRDDPTVHVMRRDCMWRHTCEVHLGMRRGT